MEMTILDYTQAAEDYRRIGQAIRFLEENHRRQPDLQEIAASVHLSEYHFQRLFTRWAGISPKRFLQYLTKEHAKSLLTGTGNLLQATYESGLSSPSRLHDLLVTTEAVTPGEYRRRGEGLTIHYGFHPGPFGECMLASTGLGLCHLSFLEDSEPGLALAALKKDWPRAHLAQDELITAPYLEQVFSFFDSPKAAPVNLFLSGTNFQIRVWEALLRIPPGTVVTYQDVAVSIGMPEASRAVGNAAGRNPLPVIIPCHRVIRKVGGFGGYRWGSERKKALLAWEASHYAGQTAEVSFSRV